jgi:hypothetical protein
MNSRDGNERLELVHREVLIRKKIVGLIDGDMVTCRLRGVVAVVWVEKIQGVEVDSEEIMNRWDRVEHQWEILGLHREMDGLVIGNGTENVNDEEVEVLGLLHENRRRKSNMVVVELHWE